MASLLLRSAGRVLRRSLPQGPFRRSPAQQFVDNPRLFSSDGVNKSRTLEKGLHQRIENSLDSIEADITATSRTQCSIAEQLEAILKKEIDNELADKTREKLVLGAFAFLGITIFAGEALFRGVKEKYQAVKPLI
ncbi:uncharacterized protein LOC124678867 isoform X2 [Lolium rigidum]|uniref:uncharacterized protein LOC124678867 isoform X2 n=1 Tax=Lolium rigidum TaxID=89674 RepID=UPI001F5DA34D|nr:uncharacterized protein LOC124678867 isoform X2 [Lolium rigidum]